jgi:hypothetical protein
MAVMKNSRGEIVAEQRVIVTNDGGLITTNTLYRDGCPVAQHVSVTDTQGRVRTQNVIGGKILP